MKEKHKYYSRTEQRRMNMRSLKIANSNRVYMLLPSLDLYFHDVIRTPICYCYIPPFSRVFHESTSLK